MQNLKGKLFFYIYSYKEIQKNMEKEFNLESGSTEWYDLIEGHYTEEMNSCTGNFYEVIEKHKKVEAYYVHGNDWLWDKRLGNLFKIACNNDDIIVLEKIK